MKQYPSIPNASFFRVRPFQASVFDKLDGQNIRAEYSRSRGFHKFGSRTQLIDDTHPDFAPAILHFRENLQDELERICRERKLQKMTVFAEWWGEHSLGGRHRMGDPLRLSVLDATCDNRGWVSPSDFRSTFEDRVATPAYLGEVLWDDAYVQRVLRGEVSCTLEGVVGKNLQGPVLTLAKAKTSVWLERIKSTYADGEKLSQS